MEIPLDAWGLPDEETMSCEDGLVENHYYMDLRGLSKTDFDFAWEAETKILAAVEEGLDLEADEAYDQYIDEMQALWGCLVCVLPRHPLQTSPARRLLGTQRPGKRYPGGCSAGRR
jgi:hypothetical protein